MVFWYTTEMARRPSSFSLAMTLVGVGVVGLALSMVLTSDTRWMQWHLSRLGEGNQLSAAIFNYTLMLAALILVLLATRLATEIQQRDPQEKARYVKNMLLATAVGWVGLGVFPFDRFQTIHHIFGYGQMLLICILMLTLKYTNRHFSQRTHGAGLFGVLIAGTLMACYHLLGVPTLLVVELCGQIVLFLWLLSMTADLREP